MPWVFCFRILHLVFDFFILSARFYENTFVLLRNIVIWHLKPQNSTFICFCAFCNRKVPDTFVLNLWTDIINPLMQPSKLKGSIM
jgi:hypothetical protein